MECNKDESLRAKEIAESKFESKDLQGAKKFALKAQSLFPELEGIGQMITTLDIHLASEVLIAGEKDWYSILSVETSADEETIKKNYRKLALQLHPDKNKSVGAKGAFTMVQEAWTVLSDKTKRAQYDQKRRLTAVRNTSRSNKASAAPGASNGFFNYVANTTAAKARANKQKAGPATSSVRPRPRPPPPRQAPAPPLTFWTSCNKCKMNYEYMRKYLNNNLLCPSCREPFLAKEIPVPPTESVHSVHNAKSSGANQSTNGANQSTDGGRNFQWGPFSRTAGAASATASSAAAAQAANMVHQTYEKVRREREEAQAAARREALRRKINPLKRQANMSENLNFGTGGNSTAKKMRTMSKDVGMGPSSILSGPGANYFGVPGGNISFSTNNGAHHFQGVNGGFSWKPRPPTRICLTRTFTQLDLRGILMEKGKSYIKDTLNEMQRVAANGKKNKNHMLKENGGDDETLASDDSTAHQDPSVYPEDNVSGDNTDADDDNGDPLSYNVPDPDFHDFDKDRTEESFQSDQIWATYDDEDGMPRYYAFIQKVLSLEPFQLKISFLTSRTNSEFGSLSWVSSGFTKTCGDFRIGRYEPCRVLNMFSHQIKWEKGPRGVIKVYPQKGTIWAVYRNWSPDWNKETPDEVLHVYDVVEVLDDYNEDHGISVIPLVKIAGFRTVFQQNQDLNAVKKIPKEEMFRFSHQVPFYRMSGEEAPNVPKDSYELDPAAISKELLQ
uniref:J domain-containing protein n=1 Tax=Leersia perrieri TaxID=77586 RepID=A0A0D9VV18_9ORYZ